MINITNTFVGKDIVFLASVNCFIVLENDKVYSNEGEFLDIIDAMPRKWFDGLSSDDINTMCSAWPKIIDDLGL